MTPQLVAAMVLCSVIASSHDNAAACSTLKRYSECARPLATFSLRDTDTFASDAVMAGNQRACSHSATGQTHQRPASTSLLSASAIFASTSLCSSATGMKKPAHRDGCNK